MALINCSECDAQISDKATACVKCGAPVPTDSQTVSARTAGNPLPVYEGSYDPPSTNEPRAQLVKSAKSRGVYVILGLFFGMLGIHNFYAGRFGIGAIQLLITVIFGWFVVGLFVTAFWSFIELFLVKTDGAGDAFA